MKVDGEDKIKNIFSDESHIDISNGIVHLVESKDKIIEVPVHDAKTHELLKLVGLEIQRIYTKYPKVKD